MSKEAMKLALEALENSVDLVREDAYQAEKLYGNYPTRQGKVNGLKVLADDHEKAITAMREALAEQPAQPMHPEIKKMYEDYFDKCFRESSEPVSENFMDALKFDVAMRDWVGLTHEEVEEVWEQVESSDFLDCVHPLARAIEAKLKEKNT